MSWKISRLNTIWFPLAFEQTFIGQRGNEKKLTNHICCFRSDKSIHSVSNRNIRPWWCWQSWRIFNIFANCQPLFWVYLETKQAHVRHMFKSICYHKQKNGQEKIWNICQKRKRRISCPRSGKRRRKQLFLSLEKVNRTLPWEGGYSGNGRKHEFWFMAARPRSLCEKWNAEDVRST